MPFTAGQKLRASELNAEFDLTQYAYAAGDVSKVSSTAMSDITGLAIPLEANSRYLLDGFLSYYSLDGVDLRLAYTGPAGMTVSWGSTGLVSSSTTQAGDTDFAAFEAYGDSVYQVINTDSFTSLIVRPSGYFATGGTAGTLQMRFAQDVSNPATLVLRRGSWLRAYKAA